MRRPGLRPVDARRGVAGRPLGCDGQQMQAERRALAELARDLDAAAEQVAQRARNRQAQAGALVLAGHAGVDLLERVEDLPQHVLRDAEAGVDDVDSARHVVLRIDDDLHRDGALVGELDGVADEVDQNLLELVGVGRERRDRRRQVRDEADLLVDHAALELRERVAHQRVEGDRDDVQLDLPRLDLREVEDRVDQPQQVLAVVEDALDIGRFLRRQDLVLAAEDDRREPDDGIERRPQLVAHVREELALRAVGLLGHVLGLAKLLLVALALGDVADERAEGGALACADGRDGELDRELCAVAPQRGDLDAFVEHRADARLEVAPHPRLV